MDGSHCVITLCYYSHYYKWVQKPAGSLRYCATLLAWVGPLRALLSGNRRSPDWNRNSMCL